MLIALVDDQLTKPLTPPPPSAKLPLYLLYVLPFVSLSFTLYLFIFRPCSTRSRLRSAKADSARPQSMIIPLLQGGSKYEEGAGCCCFASKRKPASNYGNGRSFAGQQAPINLVIDPTLFASMNSRREPMLTDYDGRAAREKRKRRKKRKERLQREEGEARDPSTRLPSIDDDDSDFSGSSTSSDAWSDSRHPTSRRWDVGHRKGILSAVHLTQAWKLARHNLRLVMAIDTLLLLLWSGASGWAIVFGRSCKPGSFDGW